MPTESFVLPPANGKIGLGSRLLLAGWVFGYAAILWVFRVLRSMERD